MRQVTGNRQQKGFTLIEAVVATAVFAFVIASIFGVYNSALQLDRKSKSQRVVAQNARFIMEYLGKEIRNGAIFYNGYPGGIADETLILANQANEVESFYLTGTDLQLEKNSTTTNLNSSGIKVTNLEFYIEPNGEPYVLGSAYNEQPRVTVALELTSDYGTSAGSLEKINLQSTFATRNYPSRVVGGAAPGTCEDAGAINFGGPLPCEYPPADTEDPIVAITAPAASASVSGSSVTVSATASDNVGVLGVQFKLDGGNLGSEDLNAPYSITWNSTTASNGSHTLTAVARDAADNSATSVGVPVTVDNNVPTVAITAPTAGALLGGSSATVSATASDNLAVLGVQFKLDGANLSSQDTSAPYSITWNTTTASNGSHTLTAVARDGSGNSTTSAGVAVTVDNAAPVVSAFDVQPRTTSGGSVLATFSATDTGGAHLKDAELWRAVYNSSNCTVLVITGCTWSQVATATGNNLDSWSGSMNNTPATGSSYIYGVHVNDNLNNYGQEPARIQVDALSSAYTIEYLVVAGGGGGGRGPDFQGNSSGAYSGGGGGGAGGVLTGSASVTPGSGKSITVGNGGGEHTSGGNSSIAGVATAIGGGAGASYNPPNHIGVGGGSGGGAPANSAVGNGTPGQGNNGGRFTGGGGGAGAIGQDGSIGGAFGRAGGGGGGALLTGAAGGGGGG